MENRLEGNIHTIKEWVYERSSILSMCIYIVCNDDYLENYKPFLKTKKERSHSVLVIENLVIWTNPFTVNYRNTEWNIKTGLYSLEEMQTYKSYYKMSFKLFNKTRVFSLKEYCLNVYLPSDTQMSKK